MRKPNLIGIEGRAIMVRPFFDVTNVTGSLAEDVRNPRDSRYEIAHIDGITNT